MSRASRVALVFLALAVIPGCGRASTISAPAPEYTIDSVFTDAPSKDAPTAIRKSEQDQKDNDTTAPETTKVGAPTNDKKG